VYVILCCVLDWAGEDCRATCRTG